jgi:hypothetical protein
MSWHAMFESDWIDGSIAFGLGQGLPSFEGFLGFLGRKGGASPICHLSGTRVSRVSGIFEPSLIVTSSTPLRLETCALPSGKHGGPCIHSVEAYSTNDEDI